MGKTNFYHLIIYFIFLNNYIFNNNGDFHGKFIECLLKIGEI